MLTLTISGVVAILKTCFFTFGYIQGSQLFPEPLAPEEERIFLEKLNHSISNKLYAFLITTLKLSKSKSLKFDISFYTGAGVVNQVLRYFNKSSNYSLDDISSYSKKIFNALFLI